MAEFGPPAALSAVLLAVEVMATCLATVVAWQLFRPRAR
jgi:hypothetical protein